MKISPLNVNFNHNIRQDNNQKVSFGYGDYGFIVNPNPDDDCAEQKQTFMEGLKGAAYILALPVILPICHIRDKAIGKVPSYSDLDRLEAEYFDDDFDEHFENEVRDKRVEKVPVEESINIEIAEVDAVDDDLDVDAVSSMFDD